MIDPVDPSPVFRDLSQMNCIVSASWSRLQTILRSTPQSPHLLGAPLSARSPLPRRTLRRPLGHAGVRGCAPRGPRTERRASLRHAFAEPCRPASSPRRHKWQWIPNPGTRPPRYSACAPHTRFAGPGERGGGAGDLPPRDLTSALLPMTLQALIADDASQHDRAIILHPVCRVMVCPTKRRGALSR